MRIKERRRPAAAARFLLQLYVRRAHYFLFLVCVAFASAVVSQLARCQYHLGVSRRCQSRREAQRSAKMALRDCRMYEQRYPEVDDVVMVQVRSRSRWPRPPSRQHWRGSGGCLRAFLRFSPASPAPPMRQRPLSCR